jgi:hypothetical protein
VGDGEGPAAVAEVVGPAADAVPSNCRICGPPSCTGGASTPGFASGSPGRPDGGGAGFGGADERAATAGADVAESPHPQQTIAPNAIARIAVCRSMIANSGKEE